MALLVSYQTYTASSSIVNETIYQNHVNTQAVQIKQYDLRRSMDRMDLIVSHLLVSWRKDDRQDDNDAKHEDGDPGEVDDKHFGRISDGGGDELG